MRILGSKPLKYSLVALATLAVLCGLLIGAFHLTVARVPEYRVQLQSWVSDKTGLAIEFRRLSARLRLFGPELVFDDAVVRTPDRTRVLATARRGSVGFDLWSSIRSGRLTAGRFTLDSPEIGLIRTRAGRIQLVGQSALPERDAKPIAVENLPVGHFRVRNAVVSFRDEATGRGPWSLSGVSFNLDRQLDSMELRGDAQLPAVLGHSLTFSASVQGELQNAQSLVSSFMIDGKQLDLAGWADVLPDEWMAPELGHGSIQLATEFKGLRLAELSAKVDLTAVTAASPTWMTPLPRAEPLRPLPEDESQDEGADADSSPITPEADAASMTPTPAEPESTQLVSYDRMAFDLHVKRKAASIETDRGETDRATADQAADSWEMSASNVDLTRKPASQSPEQSVKQPAEQPSDRPTSWRANRLAANWSHNDAGKLQLSATADRVVLQNLWPLLAYLPESAGLAHIRALQARGTIENLELGLQRDSAQDPLKYSLQADFADAGFQPVLSAPGLSGLTGHVQGTDASGEIRLDMKDAGMELPRMFRSPLQAQSIRGAIAWNHDPAGLRLSSKEMHVASEDGRAQATIELTIPADGTSPILDLNVQAQDLNVAATPRYLPANKMTPKTLEWLDHAFVLGRVPQGQITYKGPTLAFPFRHGEGEFIARGHVEGATFDYQFGWLPATKVNADVEFRNQGLKVTAGTANVGELNVANINTGIADFKIGLIAVKAEASGDLGSALRLLQGSPIKDAFGEQFQKLRGQGETRATLEIMLPLKKLEDRRVAVIAELKDTTVSAQGLDAPITHLSGSLSVRQALPDSASMRGQWLGGPVDIAILSESKSASVLTATGHATAAQLSPLLHLPPPGKITGATVWSMTTRLEADQNPDPKVSSVGAARKYTIESELNGLGIELPYPLGKPEDEDRPLRVDVEYDGDREIIGRGALGDVRALIRLRQQSDESWNFDRGGVRADGIAAALPGHRGLRIEGFVDHLVLDDWFAFKTESSGTSRLSDILEAANLTVGTLQLYGYQWPQVRGVLQATASGWRVDVAGSNAQGELIIPDDFTSAQPLTATFEHLVVTRDGKQGGASTGRDPRSWPNVRASIADLRIEDHAIGEVELQATRVESGIQIDSLTIVQDAMQGEARGQWLITSDGERSKLSAKVTSTDVAATLRAANYTPFIEAKHGEITADLSWPGGFDDDFPGRASGTVQVTAENGQLLNLQPGAGRVLGLMSVSALPRRLSLDFSDLTDKGLSFDTIHGDFELRDGNAYTNNLLLRGPAVEIGIAGRTGIGAHDYDQTAVVTGNLGATLPVAGALAAGPAVGAALLLFTQVFKEPLKGIARGYYRITGPWEDPVVERVDAAQIKEAAATTGDGT